MLRRAVSLFLAVCIVGGTFIASKAEGAKITPTEALTIAKEIDEDNAYILTALAGRESSFRPYVSNGECLGLCQINPKYWQAEIDKLGINDLFDAKQNMTLANEILNSTDYPIELKLMLYNMKRTTAFNLWEQGTVTDYAKGIIQMSEQYRLEDFLQEVNAVAVESNSNQLMVMSEESYELCKPLDIRVLFDNNLKKYEWELFEK